MIARRTPLLVSLIAVLGLGLLGCSQTTSSSTYDLSRPPEAMHASYEEPRASDDVHRSRTYDPGEVEFFPAVD